MSERIQLSMDEMEEVSGGDIGWSKRNMSFTIMDHNTRQVTESYTINDGMWDTFATLRNNHQGFGGSYDDEAFRDLLLANGVIS